MSRSLIPAALQRYWDETPPAELVLSRSAVNSALIFALIMMAALLSQADFNGYEGDDLNSIIPVFQFDAAMDGLIALYRYDWQPLTYQLARGIYDLTGDPNFIFAIAPIFIGGALGVLYFALRGLYGVSTATVLCLLLLTPEIIFTGLYYNSSAPAYFFAVCAFASLFGALGRRRMMLISVLMGVSILFRLEFILLAPLVYILMLIRSRDLLNSFIAGFALCVILALAFLTELIRWEYFLDSLLWHGEELAARADEPGWDRRKKTFVLSVILSPLGWAFFLAGALFALLKSPQRWQGVALFAAFIPTLYSVPEILSAKYMMPAFVALPFFAGYVWRMALDAPPMLSAKTLSRTLYAASLFFLILSLEPTKDAPFLRVTIFDARQIGTHDGARSWGAYLTQWARVDQQKALDARQVAGAVLTKTVLEGPAKRIIYVGDDNYFQGGGAGWRIAQLALVKAGHRGEVLGPNLIRYIVEGREFWLTEDLAHIPDNPAIALDETLIFNGYKTTESAIVLTSP